MKGIEVFDVRFIIRAVGLSKENRDPELSFYGLEVSEFRFSVRCSESLLPVRQRVPTAGSGTPRAPPLRRQPRRT